MDRIRPPCDNGAVSGLTIFDLDLDLDAYGGPFDLLLALVLREELELVEVPIAEIVLTYIERMAEAEELDLEAVSEFLLLVAALCEVKSRRLLGEGESDAEEQGPEEAAAELAERLAEYQRFRAAAGWLGERREQLGRRVFRSVRAPLAPRPRPADLRPERPAALAEALGRLLEPPARLEISAIRGRSVPVGPFLRRFRELLRGRGTFLFDEQVNGLPRDEQAAAFLAILELYKRGELRAGQAEPFGPIRVARTVGLLAGMTPPEHDESEQDRQAVA
jgi:segregation and condensation protein A